MLNIETWFELTWYGVKRRRMTHRYPTYKIEQGPISIHDTLEEAESNLQCTARSNQDVPYCYLISEVPNGFQCYEGESFSERLYLPDGKLWSVRDYAYMIPREIPPEYTEIEFDNEIYGRGVFEGRNPEEIKFKIGDIIEILCYSGNNYWGNSSVELAIVAGLPPSRVEMKKRMDHYLRTETHSLTGDRGFDLGVQFNADNDVYTVIPAYMPTAAKKLIDYCPTHCAMIPRYPVSERIQTRLHQMLNKYFKQQLSL